MRSSWAWRCTRSTSSSWSSRPARARAFPLGTERWQIHSCARRGYLNDHPRSWRSLRELLADKFEVDPARHHGPRPTCIATSFLDSIDAVDLVIKLQEMTGSAQARRVQER